MTRRYGAVHRYAHVFELLGRYAWLIGDVALMLWAIYEIVSLGPRKPKEKKDADPKDR